MGRIGIIGAMPMEVEQLQAEMEQTQVDRVGHLSFYRGILWGREAVAAVSGVGKVNAAICAQTMILKYAPDEIINTGVSGGHKSLKVCDIVLANQVVQHDFDTSPLGDEVGQIGGLNQVYLPCAEHILKGLSAAAERLGKAYHVGVVASGDQFINSRSKADWISDTFGAVSYEMEGGSIGQVCLLNHTDFGAVRIISDNGDEKSHMDFPQFAAIAVEESVALLREYFRGEAK